MLYGVRVYKIYIFFFVFLVYGARPTPRLQAHRIATLCAGIASALYNDTAAARTATSRR